MVLWYKCIQKVEYRRVWYVYDRCKVYDVGKCEVSEFCGGEGCGGVGYPTCNFYIRYLYYNSIKAP